jgi:aldose 1-epimerase
MNFGYQIEVHPDFDKKVICLFGQDDAGNRAIEMKYSPENGCNMFSFICDETQYLFEKTNFQGDLMLLGSPILYPSPNRIRNAQFTFDDREFRFEPNEGTNFLHGLVTSYPWDHDEPEITSDSVSVRNTVSFIEGNDLYHKYPVENRLELTYTLKKDRVCLDFRVVNLDKKHRLPFGLGIHPYFNLIGSREDICLHVPAKKWMEAVDRLPTGNLIDLADSPGDMSLPTPLSELNLDDVYWGMEPDQPQSIYYDKLGRRLIFHASEIFTHSCIFCPPHLPLFCVENQTCSADAHNLHAQGFPNAANLLILEPGETLSAKIEIEISTTERNT